jgi:predicted Zn-dependent peptidase
MRLASVFEMSIPVDEDHFAEDVLPLVDEEIGRLGREGPGMDELAAAQAGWSSYELFRLETPRGRAFHLASDAVEGSVAAPYDWFRADRAKADANTVGDAVRRWLPTTDRVVVIAHHVEGATVAGYERSSSKRAK